MTRRDFLATFSLGAAPFQSLAQRRTGRLKITQVRNVNLRVVRDAGSVEPAWNPGSSMRFTVGGGSVVEVLTDQGLSGIGPGIDDSLLPAVKAQLVGKDPFDTEEHTARLRYYAAGASYRGGANVDIALWDLIGKACGQPLYRLWGGGKDRVIPYASMIRLGTPDERARLAKQLADEGWKAIKLRLHHATVKEDLRTVEAVRQATGDRMTIMVGREPGAIGRQLAAGGLVGLPARVRHGDRTRKDGRLLAGGAAPALRLPATGRTQPSPPNAAGRRREQSGIP